MNFEPLKEFLDTCLPMLGIPGSDTIVYKGHEEVFRYQSGFDNLRLRTPVRPDALYHMYSVTKVSTCVAATQLIERGEIMITDPVSAYFPEYKDIKVRVKNPDGTFDIRPAKTQLLIKHLLSMTGGLDYDLNRPGIKRVKERTGGICPTLDIVRALAEDPFLFDPGADYHYSLCLDVMGGIIELVSGMKLSDYMRENIFEPLGMYNTSFGLTDSKLERLATQYLYDANTKSAKEVAKDYNPYAFGSEYDSGGAGLISTVEDQILLADALTHLGVGKNGNRILSSYGTNLMRTNILNDVQYATFNKTPQVRGYGYGYGVRTNMHPEEAGNLMPAGEFGWDGARLSYISSCPESGISIFHAEHMGALHGTVIPRLRNIIYSCMD
ncbi:MAG: beta-lactamase family protein [Clostridia bacterium]|nr:beta-lactamase family protein [Clostridia bacterium]